MGSLPGVTNRGMNAPLSKTQMLKENAENFTPIVSGRSMRDPIRHIYIHSVSRRSFLVRNPPLFPKLEMRGCEEGQRYVTCTSLPDPIIQVSADNERGGNRLDDNDAWVAAIDTLRPGNFTMDPYSGSDNPDFYANRLKTNLICEGVFPSLNEKPTEAELKRAEDCRNRRYRWLTSEAKRLAAVSRVALNEFLQQNPEVHTAMDVLGMTAEWHQENDVKVSCPNCGDAIKSGLAFHKSSATDALCVIDAQRAFKAGAISKEKYEELAAVVHRGPGR